jgi:hypothetical protein
LAFLRPPLLAVAAAALLAAQPVCRREAPAVRQSEAGPTLGSLSAALSEPGGYFDTDNFISNETSFLQVAELLDAEVPRGGVYLGVGPDQNFSYIARTRPRRAIVVDIRRQNMLQHLLFASIFERADDPYQFLCRLLGRPCPAKTPLPAGAGIARVVEAVEAVAPGEEAFERNLREAYEHIETRLGFDLTPEDRKTIRYVSRAFHDEQLDIRFRSLRRPSMSYHPTYRALIHARSPSGRFGHFLASEEDYRVVRDLERARRVVPVVGDFAGPQALRAVGRYLREQGEMVSAFYASNVEFYLVRDGGFERFMANVKALPLDPKSVFIRAYFDYGRGHPAGMPGHRSATFLQRIPRFLELFDSGALPGYWEVCTTEYLK